ncbi:MAG: hypothetical protein KID05_21750 [Pseudomonas sp.]|uniref:hypothetical protein n=1 Tax=Pseudomonas sp. TaxID=306 RepID=UPI0023537E8A|nr:hypothetical protein [Pseudomonas sp.]MBS5841741.1 hypothetical protein [Pseudomonas sp.]
MADLDDLKRKRDQLTAKIQQAEARQRGKTKKEEDRVKILVGAAVLNQQTQNTDKHAALLTLLDNFLTRPAERVAVLGEDGQGSDVLKKMMSPR